MKTTLEFDIDEQDQALAAMMAMDIIGAITDYDEYLRRLEDESETVSIADVRERLREFLDGRNVLGIVLG